MERICVIGGGITGLFTALDLSINGFDVTLIEKNRILSGASGRFHGMLHSGSRYSVNDKKSAMECISENRIISSNASMFVNNTGGYFIGINDEDLDYGKKLIHENKIIGIETDEIEINDLMRIEPYINKNTLMALKVPDKTINGHAFAGAVAVEASMNGARILDNSMIIDADVSDGYINNVRISKDNDVFNESFDFYVNTAGAWSSEVLKKFGIDSLDVMPTLGYMASYNFRFSNSIINRMREPSDGDIIVPYGSHSVAGTIAIVSDDPDNNNVDNDDIKMMIDEVSEMIPAIKYFNYEKLYYSMRPLVRNGNPRGSRDFMIYDNLGNLISSIGGKFTTARLNAEEITDNIIKKFGSHRNYKTSDINFNETFSRFIERNDLNINYINYIKSLYNSMDYEYALHIMSSYLLSRVVH
ncbi:FAD-dependent oxidoreductase [Picrophilus oshimae]|uniref:Anaerobic glycerol-3-phosphate dehydrogenase subunit A n=1 Tax=Picrophilus torridus (strain ATCC 700027 / DSM 9790 / JCM 10055 / NBRC 100828 / KAW 2/3) TaxID=1122961 RepID=Q6KYY1_PICTO|nr:FAD-dependent oxidoreductase [Picrophilus oshimae]AAT44071.1 anaerobic glycerol-3-phosphate dehydrogenase subunit A [Picrophilus oshimae DSM 9789]